MSFSEIDNSTRQRQAHCLRSPSPPPLSFSVGVFFLFSFLGLAHAPLRSCSHRPFCPFCPFRLPPPPPPFHSPSLVDLVQLAVFTHYL